MSEDAMPKAPPPLPPTLPKARKKSFWRSPGGVAAIIGFVIAGMLVLAVSAFGVIIQLGYFPDSAAVRGEDLPDHVLEKLREADIVADDEDVLYFYCGALFDYLEDGNLFTDRRVISYYADEGDVVVDAAAYAEIVDIEVEEAGSWIDDALITIERKDGSEFVLYVSGEKRGDRKFAKALDRAWERHR